MSRARDRADGDFAGKELIFDADGDTSITADTDDQIDIKVAGSDHVKIKGGTNVVHVIEGSSGQGTPHTNSGLVIESDGETGINILTGNTNYGGIVFGDDGDNDIGFIQYKHDDNYIRFGTNTTERMRIDASGNIGLGGNTLNTYSGYTTITLGGASSTAGTAIDFEDSSANRDAQIYARSDGLYLSGNDIIVETGDIVFATSGKGINLGVTSNTDDNTLDDYEEGTFTPAADGYSGTMTFTTANYVKVGRQVTIAFKMTGDGTSDSSTVAISGFPFAVQSEHPAALSYSTASNANLHATSNPIPNSMLNTAEIMYFYMPEGTGFTYTNLGSGYIRVACTYLTTA